jgi:hypothetical protein
MSWQITDLVGVAGIIREIRESWCAKRAWPLEEQQRFLEILNQQLEYTSKIFVLAERHNLSPQDVLALMAPDCACYVIHLEEYPKALAEKLIDLPKKSPSKPTY